MKIGFIYTDSNMLNHAQQIMALCTEKGALDELGIGRIRDLFSNALFPGITSLQTRAKYSAYGSNCRLNAEQYCSIGHFAG